MPEPSSLTGVDGRRLRGRLLTDSEYMFTTAGDAAFTALAKLKWLALSGALFVESCSRNNSGENTNR